MKKNNMVKILATLAIAGLSITTTYATVGQKITVYGKAKMVNGVATVSGNIVDQGSTGITTIAQGFPSSLNPTNILPFSTSQADEVVTYVDSAGYGCMFDVHVATTMGSPSDIAGMPIDNHSSCTIINNNNEWDLGVAAYVPINGKK